MAAAIHVLEHPQSTALYIGQSHAGMAMMAVLSGDAAVAAQKYDIIKAWRNTFIFFCISADRLLGLVAHTMGQTDQAIIHFEEALTFCRNGGYRPELAWACHDFAEMLLERDSQEDRPRSTGLLEESLAISNELGMRPLVERVTALQQRAPSPPG